MFGHIEAENCQLVRIVMIGGDHQNDQKYHSLANFLLIDKKIKADIESNIRAGDEPAAIAKLVSSTIRGAAADKAELWVDLTPGPKERSAVIFAAASAVSNQRGIETDSHELRLLP